MFRIKKIKVGEEVADFGRQLRLFRRELALRSIQHINPLIARGVLASEISNKVRSGIDSILLTRKIEKIASSKHGRSYINNVVIHLAKIHGKENAEIFGQNTEISTKAHLIRRELKNLYKSNIKGIDYINNVRSIIYKHFDKRIAAKIDKELMIRLYFVETGKKGVVDPLDGRTFYVQDNGKLSFTKFPKQKLGEAASKAGIKVRKKDYFELKVAKITVQALRQSSTPEEAAKIFEELYSKERASDPIFRQAERETLLKSVVDFYNKAAIHKAMEDLLVIIPSKMVALASRILARTMAMIPIVGSIASAQYEAAAAISEIGETLRNRIESSSYVWYNLSNALGPNANIIRDSFMKQINQAQ